jgi:hypothetical protein
MVVVGIFGMLGKNDWHCAGKGSRRLTMEGETMGSCRLRKDPKRLLKENAVGKKGCIGNDGVLWGTEVRSGMCAFVAR